MTGLVRKFVVLRTNPESQARHVDCECFVLDYDHDPHALPALMAYADSVETSEPDLARDLRAIVKART